MDKNLQREFQKLDAVLKQCQKYFEHMAKMNATLHSAPEVFYSPLHAKITSARAGVKLLIAPPVVEQPARQEEPQKEQL